MATTTRSLTIPNREAGEGRCKCGCAPCEGACCRLDCIVQPRFFCGQLLTDQDLSALVGWARDKFGLSRYRHGWGVVCGLDVRCAADAKNPLRIGVTPGYAVGCCGDDIIVCEEAWLDLSEACREEADPCADLRRQLKGAGGARLDGGQADENFRAVDIYIRYDEKPAGATTAFGRSACKETPECDYNRTEESYKLSWEFGTTGDDPLAAAARRWREGYDKCLEVLTEFGNRFANISASMGEELRRWLVGWIDKHPLRHFCYLRTEICRAEAADVVRREKLADWLFILAMDCRLSFLNCGCTGCEPDAGVPLARVWLQSDDERWGRENCRVVFIDPYPPFRRPVRPDCWPAPLGSINAGRAIWHRAEEACTMLSDLGVRLREPAEMFKPAELADLAELETRLSCDPFIACGEQRTPLVFDAGPLGLRVVGFCATNAPKPEPPPPPPPPPPPQGEIVPSIKLMKFTNTGATVETTEVTPNDRVQYVFRVRNETGGGLTAVDLFDEQTGSGEGAIEVDSGKTFETKSSVVSASKLRTTGDDNKIINVLTVEGLDASNQLFKKMATSEAKLVLTPNPAGVDTTKPPAVAKPARRDDFTILSGISEARSSALHDAGINTFAELAAAPVERLREITSTSEKVVLQWIKTARETA